MPSPAPDAPETSLATHPPFPSPTLFTILPQLHTILSNLSTQSQNNISDLPSQVYPLRQQLGKAKASLKLLPDMERTVEQQEEEIRSLERKVKGFRQRLAELGDIARTGRDGKDGTMEGVESDIKEEGKSG